MPSPLGHALAGAAAGLLVAGHHPRPLLLAAACAVVACLPDLDLLSSRHSGATHSIGLVATAGLVFYAGNRNRRIALAAAAAYGSHVLFDWMGRDTSPPLGVMALWPFSSEFYISPFPVLEPVSRRYWLPGFWAHTARVAVLELLLFGSLAGFAWWRREHQRRVG
jgi:inner membrane protein